MLMIVQLVLWLMFLNAIQGKHKHCKHDYGGTCKKICNYDEVAILTGGCKCSQCCVQQVNKTSDCINDGNTCKNTCSDPGLFDTGKKCCDGKICCCNDESPCLCKDNCGMDEEAGVGTCCDKSKKCCLPCNKTSDCINDGNTCKNSCSDPGLFDTGTKCCDGKICCCNDESPCLCKDNCGMDEEAGVGTCCDKSKKCCLPCNKTAICIKTGNTCKDTCPDHLDTGTECCNGQTCCCNYSTLYDVAYGKIASQSSTYQNKQRYIASKAVDGDPDTFSHTAKELEPSWWVDLGQEYTIRRIEVTNRVNCCGARFHDVNVTIGATLDNMNLCAHYKGPGENGEQIVINCTMPIVGRFVKLTITEGKELLHIAEVKAMTCASD